MPEAIIIIPVKDSLNTTKLTLQALTKTEANVQMFIFNDFSQQETKDYLDIAGEKLGFEVIHLEDIASTPSPNYKLVLETTQKMALAKKCPMIIVESDVIVKPDTISSLLEISKTHDNVGMVGAITVDRSGNYNFPYLFEKVKSNKTIITSHSLSFCCTLITTDLLKRFDFTTLPTSKDWFDVYISRQSRNIGFKNYLAKGTEVLHLPHSSRPWKNLKYTNPIKYYWRKITKGLDKI